MEYMWYLLGLNGLHINPSRTEAIMRWHESSQCGSVCFRLSHGGYPLPWGWPEAGDPTCAFFIPTERSKDTGDKQLLVIKAAFKEG